MPPGIIPLTAFSLLQTRTQTVCLCSFVHLLVLMRLSLSLSLSRARARVSFPFACPFFFLLLLLLFFWGGGCIDATLAILINCVPHGRTRMHCTRTRTHARTHAQQLRLGSDRRQRTAKHCHTGFYVNPRTLVGCHLSRNRNGGRGCTPHQCPLSILSLSPSL